MTLLLLILHGLVGVALLGAITHQSVSLLASRRETRSSSFAGRYAGVRQQSFTVAVAALFAADVVLGAVIYPDYRLDVRIPFEEMALGWAIGLFELKEHFGGIGLAVLPLYAHLHRPDLAASHRLDRTLVTLVLALIVWWNFVVGHVLNNIRGLG